MGASSVPPPASLQIHQDSRVFPLEVPLSTSSDSSLRDLETQELVAHSQSTSSLTRASKLHTIQIHDSEEDDEDDLEKAAVSSRRIPNASKRRDYVTLNESKRSTERPLNTSVELKKLLALSYPIVFTYVLEFLPGFVSIVLVGRMDSPHTKEYVDGATLASMFIYLSGEAPGFGLATALDTLCSQAFGAGKPQKIGISFQTGLLVLSLVFVPVFWLNWYSAHFMTMMHQPEEVAELTGRFSRLMLPGLPFLYVYELLKKVLQAQNIVAPMVWIAILSNVVNIALGVYLTWYTPLGYDGAAIARTVSNAVLPLATIPYFMWKPENLHAWWPGWQPRAALEHVRVFLALGIPGMFMLVVEWFSYEIMAVFAGLLPNSVVAISVHSVLTNVANFAFHCFIGVGVATNVMIGYYVGSGHREHAKLASKLGMAVSLVIALVLIITIVLTHSVLPEMFIKDDESIELASVAVLYLIPFELLDAVNCVMQGVFRGTGQQTFAAVVNLVCYFVIGLPCGFLLAFNLHMGVQGFWLGLTFGYVCSAALSFYKIWYTDWAAMTEEAKERTEAK